MEQLRPWLITRWEQFLNLSNSPIKSVFNWPPKDPIHHEFLNEFETDSVIYFNNLSANRSFAKLHTEVLRIRNIINTEIRAIKAAGLGRIKENNQNDLELTFNIFSTTDSATSIARKTGTVCRSIHTALG